MADFVQHLINGIAAGTIYALVALGYTMVYGVLKLINFAHGDVMMVGTFVAYAVARGLGRPVQTSFLGVSAIFLVAMGGCALLGLVIERFAYRPLRDKPRLTALITAIGISFTLSYGFQLVFGDRAVVIWNWQVISLAIALLLMVALQALVYRSRFGRAMRAVSFDHRTAGLMGIPVDRVIALTFMLGSALAAGAGILFAIKDTVV